MSNLSTEKSNGSRHHPHTLSAMDFQSATLGVAAKSMRNELNKMSHSIQDMKSRRAFQNEMDNFFNLFTRYLSEKSKGAKLDWDKVKEPSPEQIIPYKKLSKCDNPEYLNKLAVLKLNGGLGTTMGCVGPKSAIEVRDGMTFLDLSVRQIEYLNSKYDVNVPFILMNSFNTDEETKRIVHKYSSHKISLLTFNQSRYPRINKESLLPMPRSPEDDISKWYPPGHGDLFESMYNSGILDQLISEGKEYLFVSNVDNLGAVVDLNILQYMVEEDAEFLMEVTDKTKADIKGGTLIDYEGTVRLLEVAQVPPEHMDEFKSIKKFRIFNTNNLWVNLKAIKRINDEKELNLEVIVNNKTLENGEKVIQLETAVGAAIKHFKNAHGINVPRNRFLPVKSTSDLFLVTSDLYSLNHGELKMNPKRLFQTVPLVKLGDEFKKVANFLSRFQSIPSILELDHLTVTGDVRFGAGVELKGTVIIVANHGSRIDIPPHSLLENKVVSGNLVLLEH
ncbi:UTP--glucose-1-phosphate uridylyltransferase family [Glomus cerebriforme]|uniref:UTP--glucose-1-phosphate uridylyltransferase n=1 Tax=Glomus cerebriforme TaxID=658196 RepID=A0A397SF14_9GLOM|nr:UTP--glucose-1-phosphate uridylyltransferase family [Glomus cerebriforme]